MEKADRFRKQGRLHDQDLEDIISKIKADEEFKEGEENSKAATVCVCVFLASGYEWVTVMYEIPISSAQTMTSVHTLELSSTIPLVPPEKGLYHRRRFQRVHSIWEGSVAAAGGQFHNLGSLPYRIIVQFAGEGQTCVCTPSLNYQSIANHGTHTGMYYG